MCWACEEGIPGSVLKTDDGLSWFKIFFSVVERIEFRKVPMADQTVTASRFQIMATAKRPPTSHLLYENKHKENSTLIWIQVLVYMNKNIISNKILF